MRSSETGESSLSMFSVGERADAKYREVFSRGDGAALHFSAAAEGGGYMLLGGWGDMSASEISCLRKGRMETRVLRPAPSFGMPPCVFSTYMMFDSFGPLELPFRPWVYPAGELRNAVSAHEATNTVSFMFLDTKTWKWAALRFATMPTAWRDMFGVLWAWTAGSEPGETAETAASFEKWQNSLGAHSLESLWKVATPSGYFGEPLPGEIPGARRRS